MLSCCPFIFLGCSKTITCLFFRLESAVLDLVADDSGGMQKQKSQYHWDKVLAKADLLIFVYVDFQLETLFFGIILCYKLISTSLLWQRSKKYVKLNNGDRVTASGKVLIDNSIKFYSLQLTKILLVKCHFINQLEVSDTS